MPDEGALPTDKSFSSSTSVHKVDPSEIGKTPKGCVRLGLLFTVMIILLEVESKADEETDAAIESVLSSSPLRQIDPSEVSKKFKRTSVHKSSLKSYRHFTRI